jgi:phosphopantetheinyl transferase (holo-ACP synthase)
MTFVGNDIMFFQNNIKTFSRNNVTNKILSKNEVKLFNFKHNYINLLIAWTIKESIYKILCKEGYNKAFVPRNITISDYCFSKNESYNGTAIFKNKTYFFNSHIKKEFVYSYASNKRDTLNKTEHNFFKNDIFNNSSLTNPYFKGFLKNKNWKITYTEHGFPKITTCNNNIDISISHDHDLIITCNCIINS